MWNRPRYRHHLRSNRSTGARPSPRQFVRHTFSNINNTGSNRISCSPAAPADHYDPNTSCATYTNSSTTSACPEYGCTTDSGGRSSPNVARTAGLTPIAESPDTEPQVKKGMNSPIPL
jgi:hypothetical protein